MIINAVFASGDKIQFEVINSEIAKYYIDNLNIQNKNKFRIKSNWIDLCTSRLQNLEKCIADSNDILSSLGTNFNFSYQKLLDQSDLNRLHYEWVISHSLPLKNGNLNNILYNKNLIDDYNQLNIAIHKIESVLFKPIKYTTDWCSINNPFPKTILTNNFQNLQIGFNHLGRTLFNKYETFDNDLEYNDENTFDKLHNCIYIHLAKPKQVPFSDEYVSWCKKMNKPVSGEYIDIGTLTNLSKKLTYYREIIYNNQYVKLMYE